MNEFSAKQDNSGVCWFCGQAISDLACGNCGNCDNGRRKDKRKKSKPTYAELESENAELKEHAADWKATEAWLIGGRIVKLEARLKHTHKECEVCTMTCLDTLGDGICEGCGGHVWQEEL